MYNLQVHWLHPDSGLKTMFPTKCLIFRVPGQKTNCWTVSTLQLHHLSVEHVVMPLYSARKVVIANANQSNGPYSWYTLVAYSWYVYSLFFDISATFSDHANCTDGEMRLFGDSSPLEGRVEICANRAWGTVCGQSTWRFTEANVVCRQLGYSVFGELGS